MQSDLPLNDHSADSFGLCLPCCVAPGAPVDNPHFDLSLNPFGRIRDASTIRTILPIKCLWYPLATPILDSLLYSSHESIHLYLSDTLIGSSISFIVQCQYIEIFEKLKLGPNGHIPFPSINDDPNRIRLLKSSQYALDSIDNALALVHELFASSLVSVLIKKHALLMTNQLANSIMDNFHLSLNEPMSTSLPQGFGFINIGEFPELETRATEVNDYVIEFYNGVFGKLGYDFADLESRLTIALSRICDSLDPDDFSLLLEISTYPFNMPVFYGDEERPIDFMHLRSPHLYAIEGKTRVLDRLHRLIEVINRAPILHGKKEWELYLSLALRGYIGWRSYAGQLASNISALWEQEGDNNGLAKAYYQLYAEPSQLLGIFPALPVMHPGAWLFFHNRRELSNLYQFVVLFEVLRQAVFTGRGLVCLCENSAKGDCLVREIFAECWQMLVHEDGETKNGTPVWGKPECL